MKSIYLLILTLLLYPNISFSAVSKELAKQLNHELTPMGAEKSENNTGEIPSWRGGLKKKPLLTGNHQDPYANEKARFIITHDNANKYADKLSPGLQSLLSTYPDTFEIPVYPTHRSASFPEQIYQNTQWNAEHTRLGANLNSIVDARGGTPFPIPQSGIEVIWNHLLRWRGNYAHQVSNEGIVYESGQHKIIKTLLEVAFPFYYETQSSLANNINFYYTSQILAPASLAGGTLLVVETLDQTSRPRQVWGYDKSQLRVRRFPHVDFDNPVILAENLRTTDDTDMYSGSPTHFEWTIRGKRSLYIPYNNYRMSDTNEPIETLLTKNHLNPTHTRFELHRVWEVEGILKLQHRHIYSKRTFFIDEDSWSIVMADQYDQNGKLWRVSLAYLKNFYEVPVVYPAATVYHDLKKGRYHFQGLTNGEPSRGNFLLPPPPKSHFTPAGLRTNIRR